MTKKITLLLVIFLIWGCGYQPIYLKKNNSVQKIKTITLSGDQKINKIIINSLGLKEDRNLLTGYSLILKSLKRIDIISKDKNGNPSAYKTFITVDISLAEKETIIKQKEFVSSFKKDNIYGVQFHPEKSHKYGLSLIKKFMTL